MERFKLFIPLMIFVVLAVALYFGLGRDPSAMPSALVDKPIPAFNLPALAGVSKSEKFLDESLFKGEPTLLNVWATWCVSCRVEHPYLMALAEQGVRIIGLNYKDQSDAARQWLVDFGDPYRGVIVDAEGKLGLDLGVFGAPETYVVDSGGLIRYKFVGVVDDRVWQQKIAPIFRELGSAGLGPSRVGDD